MFLSACDIPDFREPLLKRRPDLRQTPAGGALGCFCANLNSDSEEFELHLRQMYQRRSLGLSGSGADVKGVPDPRRCSQVSSRGRCCSWPGRWSCSLQERGRSCRWGRRTPRTRPVPGRPERATACRRRAGGCPSEWCWRLKVSARGKKIKRHAGSHSKNFTTGALK